MKARNKKKRTSKINGRVEEKKRFKKVLLALIVMGIFSMLSITTFYFINMKKVSNDSTQKEIVIESGINGYVSNIAKKLKKENLIRNITMFKVYARLSGKTNLKAGSYKLSENMGVKKIIDILSEGTKRNPDEITITFKEGNNVRKFALSVSEKTNNSYDDVLNTISDSEYIDSLIEKYWFITTDIKNKDIYYPLEGYLYPDTYAFNNKEVSVKDIITKLLDETNNKLSEYKDDINNSKYSIHEIITLASIIELEGANAKDRKAVAGVFINRLNSNSYPTLGSDATTYYASKIDDWSYSLTYKELNDCTNKYNTRCSSNTGLPIGPICNPSIESSEAVINPEEHNYYYFVADCKGNVYLSENETVHYNTINKLKREKNWCA